MSSLWDNNLLHYITNATLVSNRKKRSIKTTEEGT